MIAKVRNLSEEQLEKIRKTVGEAFVSNELFHNWGDEAGRAPQPVGMNGPDRRPEENDMKKQYDIHPHFRLLSAIRPPLKKENMPRMQKMMGLLFDRQRSDRRVKVEKLVIPAGDTCVRALLYVPKEEKTKACLLYCHGGGYAFPAAPYQYRLARIYAERVGCRVLFPDYRLAPEHPFPAALQDALTAYRYLIKTCGIAPRKLILCGESAGGGLLYALCLKCRELGLPQPAGLVAISPWTDLTLSGASYEYNREADPSMTQEKLQIFARDYTDRPEDPLCSPLFGDLSGLPACRIFVGGDEIMLEDSLRMAKALEAAGVPVTLTVAEGFWHAYIFYGIRSRRTDNKAICEFIRSRLA